MQKDQSLKEQIQKIPTKSTAVTSKDNQTEKAQKSPPVVDEEMGQKVTKESQETLFCGLPLPSSSSLVSVIKLSSLLYFAAAASLILMGIEFSDGSLYVKTQHQELVYTLVFFVTALVLIVNSAVVLNSVNRKLTKFTRQYMVLGPFLILLLAIGVLSVTIKYNDQKVATEFNTACKDPSNTISQLDSYVQNSYRVMCSLFCPCQLKDLPTSALNNKQFYLDNDNGFTKIQDCFSNHPDIQSTPKPEMMAMATLMEKDFQCAGVCTPVDFYVFSDTMRGRPQRTCGAVMVEEIQGAAQQVMVTACLALAGSIITGFAGFTLARHYSDFDPTLDYTDRSIELQLSTNSIDQAPLLRGLDHTELAIKYHNLQGLQGQQYQAPTLPTQSSNSPTQASIVNPISPRRSRLPSEQFFINQLTPKTIPNKFTQGPQININVNVKEQKKSRFMQKFEPAYIGLAASPAIQPQQTLQLNKQDSDDSQKSLGLPIQPPFMAMASENALRAKTNKQGARQRITSNVTDNLFNLSEVEPATPFRKGGDEQTIDGISSIGGRRLSIVQNDREEIPDFRMGDQNTSSVIMTGLDVGAAENEEQKSSPNFGQLSAEKRQRGYSVRMNPNQQTQVRNQREQKQRSSDKRQ